MINKLISSTNKTNSTSFTFKGRSFIYMSILKTEEFQVPSPMALHVVVPHTRKIFIRTIGYLITLMYLDKLLSICQV